MARFQHLLFVCTHERDTASGKKSCAGRGSRALLDALKDEVAAHKLKGRVRVVSSGCLGLCSKGCAVLALSAPSQPHGTSDELAPVVARENWYTHLDSKDAPGLFAAHVLQNGTDEAHLEVMPEAVSTKIS